MIDVHTLKSPRELYEVTGLGKVRWPALTEFREVTGAIQINGRAVPAFPVVGDHQCALAGALLAEGELSINISTGSQVALLSHVASSSARCQTRCYFDGLLLNTVTHLPAGRALNALVDLLCELPQRAGLPINDPWALITPLLSGGGGASDLRVRTTLFKGPMGERGAIENVSVNNLSVTTVMRAALSDMASHYRQAATWIASDGDWSQVALSGGMAQKLAPLRDAIAQQFPGKPLRVSLSSEETLNGLMVLAMVIGGRAANVAEATGILMARAPAAS